MQIINQKNDFELIKNEYLENGLVTINDTHKLMTFITGNPLFNNDILCFASRYTADDFL